MGFAYTNIDLKNGRYHNHFQLSKIAKKRTRTITKSTFRKVSKYSVGSIGHLPFTKWRCNCARSSLGGRAKVRMLKLVGADINQDCMAMLFPSRGHATMESHRTGMNWSRGHATMDNSWNQ